MFKERDIVYFTPFYFKNGKSTPKPKYCVILKHCNDNYLIASLGTTRDSIPSKNTIEDGCIDISESNFNCFVISPNTIVTECGKMFYQSTHFYGQQLDMHDLNIWKDVYKIENTYYEICGKMKPCIYNKLLSCFKNSGTVKNKYKRLL
jgi:hypothetical protein